MNSFKKTISIHETLDERIKMLQEELNLYEEEKKQIVLAKNSKSFIRFFLYLGLIISVLIFLICILLTFESGNDNGMNGFIAFIFFLGLIFYGGLCGTSFDKEKFNQLNELINNLEIDIKKLRKEKREIILKYEREIKDSENDDFIKEEDFLVTEKECPMCAEMVKIKAKKCRFCGHMFGEEIIN